MKNARKIENEEEKVCAFSIEAPILYLAVELGVFVYLFLLISTLIHSGIRIISIITIM
jgi:hypothetical protein